MADITGERSVEIDAPIDRVFAIAADLERAPGWQGSLRSVSVLERDDAGRARLADCENDAKVRTVRSRLRLSYDPPVSMSWVQESGDVKALHGSWTLEDLGGGRTRATYALAADPGRMLGILLRGPAVDAVRSSLLGDAPDGLKRTAEAAG
jgi:uncharacterized protein YndB with AHSA1/START domain